MVEMPRKGLSMRKVREVLRLRFGAGLSTRQIAQSCNIGHSTVREHEQRARASGLGWPLPEDMDDTRLKAVLFQRPKLSPTRPLPDMTFLHTEMRRKDVTLQLLWYEYKKDYPDGYQYTQFCEHYRRHCRKLDLSLRQEHKAGEKMFADWAGKVIPVVDRHTGEITPASIFVAVLGASNYTYVEAAPSRILANWITVHLHAFAFFGGVTEIIVVDNLKTGVKSPCRYEPDINPAYQDMAAHYGTVVIPTRVRSPKDNAKAEVGVQVVQRWILAALRNHTFFSIDELNAAIGELLEWLNNRKFKKLPTTRRELFEKLDRPALKPLPPRHYPFVEWKTARVNIDYHIEVDHHLYSVPYQLVSRWMSAWDRRWWKCSTRTGGWPATCAVMSRAAPPLVPSTGLRPTKSTWSGLHHGSSDGLPKTVPTLGSWWRRSWFPDRTRSRVSTPVWASSGLPTASHQKGWRRPANAP